VKRICLLLVLAFLSGCATQWHQPGIPKTAMQKDLRHCEAQAYQKYPPILQMVQTSQGYWSPATEQCWHNRHNLYCQQYPAQWNPPTYATQDRNAPLRHTFVQDCMLALGFYR